MTTEVPAAKCTDDVPVNPEPLMTTEVPAVPEVGVRLVITGTVP